MHKPCYGNKGGILVNWFYKLDLLFLCFKSAADLFLYYFPSSLPLFSSFHCTCILLPRAPPLTLLTKAPLHAPCIPPYPAPPSRRPGSGGALHTAGPQLPRALAIKASPSGRKAAGGSPAASGPPRCWGHAGPGNPGSPGKLAVP